MIQLLQVVTGEIECVYSTGTELKEYLKEFHPEKQREDLFEYTNIGYGEYCMPQFRAWQLNKRLKEGKILVGVDGESFLFAMPEKKKNERNTKERIEPKEEWNEKVAQVWAGIEEGLASGKLELFIRAHIIPFIADYLSSLNYLRYQDFYNEKIAVTRLQDGGTFRGMKKKNE